MNVERIRTLYSYVTGIPAEKFKLYTWRSDNSTCSVDGESISSKKSNKKLVHECGTFGCLLGWAAAIPKFYKAGLHFDTDAEEVVYMEDMASEAGAAFFDVTYSEASALFSSSGDSYLEDDARDKTGIMWLNDKHRALGRIRHLLLEYNEISEKRYNQLAQLEVNFWAQQ